MYIMTNKLKIKEGIIVNGEGTLLDIQGTQGQLFSISDNLEGVLFSVNDISGLPILEVHSDDKVIMGTYNTSTFVVNGEVVTINGDFNLPNLPNQNAENTVLTVDSTGVVGSRELGSNAFTSVNYITGYTETDTLQSVISRGDTTTIKPVFNGGIEILSGTGGVLRIKRNLSSINGDDVVDIHMDDTGLYFDIDNDNDGDFGEFYFRKKVSGVLQDVIKANDTNLYYKTFGVYHENNLTSAVINPLISSTYVNVSGDIMNGNLTISQNSPTPFSIIRDGTYENINMSFTHSGGTFYLGLSNTEDLTFGNNQDSKNNPVLYHSGNANLSTVDWATNNLTVHGNLTIEGTTFNANTQTVLIEDNLLVINNGEVASGVASNIAGIQVDRGTATDYQFIFDETDDLFKIGEIGDLQVVATRPYVDAVENQLVNYLRSNVNDEFVGQLTVDNTNKLNPAFSWTNSALQTTSIEIVDASTNDETVCATLIMHNYGDGGVKFRMGNMGDKTLYLSSAQSNGAANPTDDNSGNYFTGLKINNNLVYHTGNLTLATLGYTGSNNANYYNGWDLLVNDSSVGNIGSNENVNFKGGSNVTLTYSTTLDNTITINADAYTAGGGLDLVGREFRHTDTSSQGSVNNTGGMFIQDITLDTYGHVTGVASVDLDDRYLFGSQKDYISVDVDNSTDDWYNLFSISDNGTQSTPITCNLKTYAHSSISFIVSKGYGSSGNITILHTNTSSNGNFKYVKGVRLLSDGKVQIKLNGGSTVNISAQIYGSNAAVLANTLTLETGTPIVIQEYSSFTNASIQGTNIIATNLIGNGSQITSLNYGYISNPPTIGGGTVNIIGGLGLTTGGSFNVNQTNNSDITLNLDFNELPIGGTLVGSDYLITENGGAENRQLISSTPLSIFFNNLGWTSNVGDITAVNINAGAGLTGTVYTASGEHNQAIAHADTSNQGSVNNTDGFVIQSIGVDVFGHVTSISSSVDLDTRYLERTGGNMSGLITFSTSSTNNGFKWNVNSDSAGIRFKNTADNDSNSFFNFYTEDNGNEYFKFSHNTWNIGSFDYMDIKNGVVRVNGNIYANATQSGEYSGGTNNLTGGNLVYHAGNLINPITGTGTSGRVAFFNGTTSQTGDSNFVWDNTNKRLGIGVPSPSERLDINGNAKIGGNLIVTGTLDVDTVNNGVGDFLTRNVNGVITRRTATEVRSDIGAQISGNYVDASGDVMTGMLSIYTSLTSNDDHINSPISIRERGLVGNTISGNPNTYAPNLNFHWGSITSNSLWMDSSGYLNWGGYNNSGVPSFDGTFKTTNLKVSVFETFDSTTPIRVKYTGRNSWVHHIGSNSELVFAPSGTVNAEDWVWSNELKINPNGRVSAKNLSLNSTNTTNTLEVGGMGRFTNDVLATNFILSSDIRLKDNVKDLNVEVIDVKWKEFNFKHQTESRKGVIAQELEEKHPEFVKTDEEGFKSVKYIDLLIAKIAELEDRIKKLEK